MIGNPWQTQFNQLENRKLKKIAQHTEKRAEDLVFGYLAHGEKHGNYLQQPKTFTTSKLKIDAVKKASLKKIIDKLRKEYWDLRKSNNTNLGRKQIDINSNSASAKGLKKVLGHVNSALENLTSQGYNIKEALNNANVSFAACPVKAKSNGTAWQLPNGAGIFTVKPLTIELETEYKKRAIARKEAGRPAWTVGGTEESSYRSTVIHEMAHALGMQKHIESPKKLQQLLIRLRSEGKLKGLNTTGNDLDNMRIWITNNISEYGSTNIKETDAELAALITSPNYTRGTLPVELENHIDELFKRNK